MPLCQHPFVRDKHCLRCLTHVCPECGGHDIKETKESSIKGMRTVFDCNSCDYYEDTFLENAWKEPQDGG